jgi:multiple sugar transport system substrate-binding protein
LSPWYRLMRGGALVLAALLLLAGCAERREAAGAVTLVFKHAKILGPSDPMPGLLREFERRHPGVSVRSEPLTWTSDEQHQFYVINLDGASPTFDVLMLDVIWVPEFAQAGWLLDLSPWVTQEELAPHFPAAVEVSTWGGRVWGMPWNMNVGVVYYRADLLAKYGLTAPRTWEELVEQAERVRAGERDPRLDGVLWQGKQYEGLVCNVLEHFWGSGATLLGNDGRVLPEPARAQAALAFMRGLVERGVSPGWVTAGDEELTRRPFGDGRAVFVRSWPYALDLFEQADSAVRGKVGLAALPGHAGGAPGAGATGGFHLAVNRATRHREAAVALVRFLATEPAQRALTAAGVALYPTRMALYHDPEIMRARPHMPRFHDLMRAARPRPVTPYYLMLSTTVQPEFSAALVGVKTPAAALEHARRRLEYMLAGIR